MKCITYVSKVVARQNGAVIPTGLAQLLTSAKRNNKELNITGVLSYRGGYYFQIIEGDDEVVDKIFSRIILDSRHEKVEVLLNFLIIRRSFPNWDMKILESVSKDVHFKKFISRYSSKIALLNDKHLKLFEKFYSLNSEADQTLLTYEGTELMLLAWPDFSVIKQSPVVIELCSKLTKQPYPYNNLLNSGQFGTKQQIDKILAMFERLSILKVIKSDDVNIPISNINPKPGSFYSKMKSFLGMS